MYDFTTSSKIEGDLLIEQKNSCNKDRILIMAIVFAMPAQQNDKGSLEALSQVMNINNSYFASDSADKPFDGDGFISTPVC